jgi:orotate phosphoribosyltransferase
VSDDLIRRMVDASELHGEFVLSSGATSTVYFDKFRFLTRADLLRDVAHAVAELLAPGTELLGAPEGAAMLLVAAVSLETGLPVSIVRKQAKAYGTKEQVEGPVPAGAVTTLLEDVSTTGHQVQRAAEVLAAAGATVARIVLAIDRGGADRLRAAGYNVEAVAVLRPTD